MIKEVILTMFSYTTKQKYKQYFRLLLLKILLSKILILFPSLTLADDKAVDSIKKYITNISNVAIEFAQSDSRGNLSEGMLIISKPYKFRCNYYSPFPLLIIGNKNYVSAYDFEMEHLSRIKASDNIFNFLLVDNIKFDQELQVLSTKEDEYSFLFKLKSNKTDKVAELSFDKMSKNINYMKIFEDDNVITINFKDSIIPKKIDKRLFIVKDPDIFGPPDRLDKEQLMKKLGF